MPLPPRRPPPPPPRRPPLPPRRHPRRPGEKDDDVAEIGVGGLYDGFDAARAMRRLPNPPGPAGGPGAGPRFRPPGNPPGPRGGPGKGPRRRCKCPGGTEGEAEEATAGLFGFGVNMPGPQGGPGAGPQFRPPLLRPGPRPGGAHPPGPEVDDDLERRSHADLEQLFERKFSEVDRDTKQAEAETNQVADDVDDDKVPESRREAAIQHRRGVAARLVALDLRRRRLRAALEFLRHTKHLKSDKEKEAGRLAAIAAVRAPIDIKDGGNDVKVVCRGFLGRRPGLGAYPGAAYDQGATVPQTGDGVFPKGVTALFRAGIQQAGMPAQANWPAPFKAPVTVPMPDVLPLQVRPPAFIPDPPHNLRITAPLAPPPGMPIRIPAMQQHPLHAGQGMRRFGPIPPQMVRQGPPGLWRRGAGTAVVRVGPNPVADTGGLGYDAMLAHCSGAFGLVLAAEAAEETVLGDFGAERRPFMGRGPLRRGLVGFKHRLQAHRTRTKEAMSGALIGAATSAALTGGMVLPGAVIGAVAAKLTNKDVDDDVRTAGAVGAGVPAPRIQLARRIRLARVLNRAQTTPCR